MGWIADVLIAVLAACAVGVMLYQKVRQAHGKGGCGCSGCSGCTGFSAAQVTIGGAQRAAFQPETMEALSQPGFYAAGEVLDVDAGCGGFNLQWAWSSGRLAGRSAAQKLIKGQAAG